MSYKLQEELSSSGTHCLYTFLESEGLYPNHMHTFRLLRKFLQSLKIIALVKHYMRSYAVSVPTVYTLFIDSEAEK